MESLPELNLRRDYFLTTFRAAATWKKKGKWSLLSYLKSQR